MPTTVPGPGPWGQRLRRRVKRRARDLLIPSERRLVVTRMRLSARHLHGSGLELGALYLPLWVRPGVHVRYVDRLDVPGLREHYPELRELDLVAPDVIADGETLDGIADGSVDFVIANHFIEHTQDPIGAIANHLRVLRAGGIVYMAVPDARYTFDRDRQRTPVEHLLRDHREGPAWSRPGHFEEWAALVERTPPDQVAERARQLDAEDYSIHFHVWTLDGFVELLTRARTDCDLPFELQAIERNGHEFVVILRRTASAVRAAPAVPATPAAMAAANGASR